MNRAREALTRAVNRAIAQGGQPIVEVPAPHVIEARRAAVCERVGANIYGRTAEFIRKAEAGDDAGARMELVELLKFFPRAPKE